MNPAPHSGTTSTTTTTTTVDPAGATHSNFAVSNTHIICFIENNESPFTDQDKSDIIESTLLAQLSANDSAKSYANVDKWMTSYLNVAGVTGWTIQFSETFKDVAKEDLNIAIDTVAARLVRQGGDGDDLRILEALLYLKGPNNSEGTDILDERGKGLTAAAFQFVTCIKDGSGNLMIRVLPYAYETIESVVSTVFQPIEKGDTYKMKYMTNPTVLVLNIQQYDMVRDSVSQKVGGYLAKLVTYLPL